MLNENGANFELQVLLTSKNEKAGKNERFAEFFRLCKKNIKK
jgi:hypothetical protein